LPALASAQSRNADILESIKARPSTSKNFSEPTVNRAAPTAPARTKSVPAGPTGTKKSNREIIASLQEQTPTPTPTPTPTKHNAGAQVGKPSPNPIPKP